MPPNLKQRLAALSLAPSSPSLPLGTLSPRRTFHPPWKRGSQDATGYEPDARDRVQEVMGRFIFQAGVDYETRPMVIINASALPDPHQVSYDLLLSRILSYLDLYVESDYTVVFFAAGGKYAPSWNWVWKAYRSLSRKYRKNLKRLYIVHSSFFSKMLFSLAGAIISPKFFRKLVYISTLSDLAHHVPLTQIDIPPAVYQENLKQEKQIDMPIPIRASIFGVPLEELMGYDGEKGSIPRVVKDAIQFIRESGLDEDGLFRRSPNSALLKQVVSVETFNDPHLASVLIKKYLRDLPDPPFPESLYPVIRQCPMASSDPADMAAVTYIRDTLLPRLMPCVYILLSPVLHLLHDVSLHSSKNRMDAHNLAIVICPNLVKSSNPMKDVLISASPSTPSGVSSASSSEGLTLGAVIKLCIQRYYEIFDEVRDRSEPMPAKSRLSRSPSPPSSSGSSESLSKPARPLSLTVDDEDSIDDAMLVMPIGPIGTTGPTSPHGRPSNATATFSVGTDTSRTVTVPYQPRQRKTPASAVGVRSVNNDSSGAGYGYTPSRSRARSTLSIERAAGLGSGSGRGSISIGRGTMRKGTGSGVEALGIIASGFFTPPSSPPRAA
ncbi:divergent CRAL/TRIO domain-containing protein [Melanogaster broomeanus]|nr:divergent CRAL/TRIO domain-containing protein [Melanogaster broomeanus]